MPNEIDEKKCSKCGEVKPPQNFNKDSSRPDGLCLVCKKCKSIYYYKKNPTYKNTSESQNSSKKVCSKCGKLKPKSDFQKDKSHQCKECVNEYGRLYKKMRRESSIDVKCCNTLDNWKQVDNTVREMAELQHFINAENAACEERLDLIRAYRDEAIEPAVGHQVALQSLITDFIKKTVTKGTITRVFRFGSVRFSHGKFNLELNVELAKKMLDKP